MPKSEDFKPSNPFKLLKPDYQCFQMTKPLILLHGALGSAAQLSELRAILAPDRPVFALNFPGHGGIPSEGPFSVASFGESVLDYLDEQQFTQVDVFGYSMGGYVALWLAWKYPERVRQVITLGTKLAWSPETASGMSRMFDAEKIALKVPHFAQYLADVHAPLDWKALCRQTADFLHQLGEGHGIPQAAYAQITCPVHIGRGDADQVVSLEECNEVADLLPNGKVHVLQGVPHGIEQADVGGIAKYVSGES